MLLILAALLSLSFDSTSAGILAASHVAGCTNDCVRLTDWTRPCPQDPVQRCVGSHIRHWTHLVPGCAITACAGGTLQYAYGTYTYGLTLVCKKGQWYEEGGRSQGANSSVTCSFFTDGGDRQGCTTCKAPTISLTCPDGKRCDKSLLTRATHPDTGCSIYKCARGGQLHAFAYNEWHNVDYVDCLHNMYWRLNSVRGTDGSLQLTCSVPAYISSTAGIQEASHVAGCTDDCVRLTDYSRPCPQSPPQKCVGANIRHWTHVIPGCAITACAGGSLQFSTYGTTLVCKKGLWYWEGGSQGANPSVTCSFFTDGGYQGCTSCKVPPTATACPSGKRCDTSLITRATHPDTGCSIYKCDRGGQLHAFSFDVWISVEYIDCLHNMYWRLNSLRGTEAGIQITCSVHEWNP